MRTVVTFEGREQGMTGKGSVAEGGWHVTDLNQGVVIRCFFNDELYIYFSYYSAGVLCIIILKNSFKKIILILTAIMFHLNFLFPKPVIISSFNKCDFQSFCYPGDPFLPSPLPSSLPHSLPSFLPSIYLLSLYLLSMYLNNDYYFH